MTYILGILFILVGCSVDRQLELGDNVYVIDGTYDGAKGRIVEYMCFTARCDYLIKLQLPHSRSVIVNEINLERLDYDPLRDNKLYTKQ